ncbi:hypothetical protein [Streptomyces atratus]|uniref:hypothetical protein n=1 Tax=Streptomyces atratus TaxID=1893 RepID=UPI001300B2BB|nr:hypothetical protein [Streptomyces atratus]
MSELHTSRWSLCGSSASPQRRVIRGSYSADLADEHGVWIRDAINAWGNELGIPLLNPAARPATGSTSLDTTAASLRPA